MKSKMRAVLYARVSSREQEKEGYSIPAQMKYFVKIARSAGQLYKNGDIETKRKLVSLMPSNLNEG